MGTRSSKPLHYPSQFLPTPYCSLSMRDSCRWTLLYRRMCPTSSKAIRVPPRFTVRNVLSQSSGLPNWRSNATPLKTYFPPGERFSYSGEGFVWLQRVVEKITGQSLNEVVTRLVFDPLEMKQSSFIWRADFETDYAGPHDAQSAPGKKWRPAKPTSASSLHTTAADYARFLQAVLSGARLNPGTAKQWLDPQVRLRQHCIECLATDAQDADQHVAWGLGWGLEPDAGFFFLLGQQ